ncbi:MAG TPA: Holliday junction resolvase RuvX [Chlamydiales bacterium]|jgi:putative Holliday junction resolvase|nr:Holliday junction resolvase RuvX [Chlamydiales bacterium]
MRIAAIDWGIKRIGIAISDERKKIALPMKTVPGGKNGAAEVIQAFALKQVELILVGLPLLLNGQEGPMAAAVRQFVLELEAMSTIPIKLIDERFSSKLADQRLREIRLKRKERTEKMDATAAAILLQGYLDNL